MLTGSEGAVTTQKTDLGVMVEFNIAVAVRKANSMLDFVGKGIEKKMASISLQN